MEDEAKNRGVLERIGLTVLGTVSLVGYAVAKATIFAYEAGCKTWESFKEGGREVKAARAAKVKPAK